MNKPRACTAIIGLTWRAFEPQQYASLANLFADELSVIDMPAQAATDADYAVTVDDIRSWKAEYGPVPSS